MAWIERDLGECNCAIEDTPGPPLMLLHGVVRRWQTFLPLVPWLRQRWKVHAVDFRGHGKSPHRAPYHVIDYAADAEVVLRQIGEPAVIYGHSLGAMVAAAVAARYPDRVRAVVLEDPPFHTMGSRLRSSPLHSFFATLQAFAGATQTVAAIVRELGSREVPTAGGGSALICELRDPVALRFSAAALQRMDSRVFDPILSGDWLVGYDWSAILAAVECPALLLQADEALGGMLTDADARHAVNAMRDCSLVKLRCGHVMHRAPGLQIAPLTAEFLECL